MSHVHHTVIKSRIRDIGSSFVQGSLNYLCNCTSPFLRDFIFSPLCCHSQRIKDLLQKINLRFILQLCSAHCTRYSITSFPVTQSSRLTGCTSSMSLTTDIPFFVLHIERCRCRIPFPYPILQEGRSCRLQERQKYCAIDRGRREPTVPLRRN